LLTKEFVDSVKYYESRTKHTFECVQTCYYFHFKSWWKPRMKISIDWVLVSSNGITSKYAPTQNIMDFNAALKTAFGY
jgi:hypothetical protein